MKGDLFSFFLSGGVGWNIQWLYSLENILDVK